MLGTYVKAAAPMLPGASRLPWVAGGGGDIPADLARERAGVAVDRDRLAAYARVCGFRLRDEVPATYPHILAFPLHMDLMTDGRFPLGPIGLVHLANRITVHRPVMVTDVLNLAVRPTSLRPHPKGRSFSLVTEARAGGELLWEEESTFLRRGSGSGDDAARAARGDGAPPPLRAEWRLPGDLGRRYAAVSGDSNPIHLHPLTARLFGFPRAIAHGMWTKARCLAALERRTTGAFTVEAEFRRPVLLPGRVSFGGDGDRFAVTSGDTVHLEGRLSA